MLRSTFNKRSSKRKNSYLVVLLCLGLFISCSLFFPSMALGNEKELDSSFTTNSFDVNVSFDPPYGFTLKENINVDFHGLKHGIYRYIPVDHSRYSLEYAYSPSHTLSKENIWFSERFPVHTVSFLRLGDENILISGNNTFSLTYYMSGKIGKHNKGDTISLNILPTRWPNEIKNTTIRINSYRPVDWSKATFYIGDELSQETIDSHPNFTGYAQDDSTYIIEGKNLPPNKGLTLVMPVEKNMWYSAYKFETLHFILTFCAGLFGLIFLLLYIFRKREEKIAPTVEFFPPENLPPADIGYIIDSTIDTKDISSMLIYFANKGYVSVEPLGDSRDAQGNPNHFIFRKLKDLDYDEPTYAHRLFYSIFNNETTEFRTDEKSEKFALALDSAEESLYNQYSKDLLSKSYKMLSFFFGLAAVIFSGFTLYMAAISGRIELINKFGIIALLVPLALLKSQMNFRLCYLKKEVLSSKKIIFKKIIALLCICYAGLVSFYFFKAGFENYILASISYFIFFISTSLIHITISGKISKDIAKLRARIVGFKHFIQVSEKDRLEALVNDNPNYFFDILPYAYVLGLSDVWIKHLDNLKDMKVPSWYIGSSSNIGFHHIYLANHLLRSSQRAYINSALAQGKAVAGSMLAKGVSTAIKGGRFSGGGFGGGGGGSW